MNEQMGVLIAVMAAVVVVALVGWAVWSATKKRRARALHEKFGPEYEHAREEYGAKAEHELEKRMERVNRLHLRPLGAEARDTFDAAWRTAQARFVDDPRLAVAEADRLIKDVMEARGYPMTDFERRAADISVEHPHVVSDYRAAHAVAVHSRQGQASTEDLRKAMMHYKALFQDLLAAKTGTMEKAHA